MLCVSGGSLLFFNSTKSLQLASDAVDWCMSDPILPYSTACCGPKSDPTCIWERRGDKFTMNYGLSPSPDTISETWGNWIKSAVERAHTSYLSAADDRMSHKKQLRQRMGCKFRTRIGTAWPATMQSIAIDPRFTVCGEHLSMYGTANIDAVWPVCLLTLLSTFYPIPHASTTPFDGFAEEPRRCGSSIE